MKTVILAGGYGTRLTEETEIKPKPMVEIGGQPAIWHIMKIYAAYGYREFVTALGYKGEIIKNYFLNYHHIRCDLRIHLGTGSVDTHTSAAEVEDWTVDLIDTGLKTDTGGRIRRLARYLEDGTFMLTYGDGVADIDISRLVSFHRSHGRLATITAVRPPARFGGLSFDGDVVTEYTEKPQLGEGWINGGFFVLEPRVLDYIRSDSTQFEREPLEALARDRQLMMYRHDGFWQCMDTLRDVRLLRDLWDRGNAPWRMW